MSLPPLKALTAFVAAARHGNFTLAADELCLTHGAISRQIAQLETHFGQALFLRQARGVVLTAAGQEVQRVAERCLNELGALTQRLQPAAGRGAVRLCMSSSFGTHWLMPRLPDFYERHPGIDLQLSASDDAPEGGRDPHDFIVRYGDGQWPGSDATQWLKETLIPVCRPDLAMRLEEDPASVPLLHDVNHDHWGWWMNHTRHPERFPQQGGMIFNDGNMLIEAALNGFGLAMGRSVLVRHLLDSHRLQVIGDEQIEAPQAYYLVRTTRHLRPEARLLWDWLMEQART